MSNEARNKKNPRTVCSILLTWQYIDHRVHGLENPHVLALLDEFSFMVETRDSYNHGLSDQLFIRRM